MNALLKVATAFAAGAAAMYLLDPETGRRRRALVRERVLRRPVVQAKLWLQHVIAGEPRFPDDAEVNQQLDREIHAAPAPPTDAGVAAEKANA